MNPESAGRTLAVIPAKGGSLRVARKNLREVGGRTLLGWAIDSALSCERLDKVIVSTEDDQIAKLARELGAEVPFMRPAHLARDPYGVVDVCLHALEMLELEGGRFENLVILLPTSPFRTSQHIQEALDVFFKGGSDFLMSVSRMDHSLLAAHVMVNTFMEPLHPEWIGRLGARAKPGELPELVKSNGAITIAKVHRIKQERSYYVYPLAAYLMPWPDGLDVDTEEDLLVAQSIFNSRFTNVDRE